MGQPAPDASISEPVRWVERMNRSEIAAGATAGETAETSAAP
ncbi:MAG: hypothetical protein ABI641_14955 [Caldimonas sp.]